LVVNVLGVFGRLPSYTADFDDYTRCRANKLPELISYISVMIP
jgi:hypothetical protein